MVMFQTILSGKYKALYFKKNTTTTTSKYVDPVSV